MRRATPPKHRGDDAARISVARYLEAGLTGYTYLSDEPLG